MSQTASFFRAMEKRARTDGRLYRVAMHGHEAIKALASGDSRRAEMKLAVMACEIAAQKELWETSSIHAQVEPLND